MYKAYRAGLVIAVMILSIFFSGCSRGITHKYVNQDKSAGLVITKSVYSENELKLYIDGMKGEYKITAFDSDFNPIDEEFSTEYKRGVYTIRGIGAEKISGLYMDGNNRYHFRYLDSDEYAVLYEYDATEIGWETFGDTEKYYTAEELAEQQAARDKEAAVQEENYRAIEGTWICERDPSQYIKVYQDAEGHRKLEWNRELSEGEYYLDVMYIAVVNINPGAYGIEVEIMDNPYWGMMQRFYMSEDMSQIKDGYYEEDNIYVRDTESTGKTVWE